MKPQHLAIAAASAWSFAAVSYGLYQTLTVQRSLLVFVFNVAIVLAGSLGIAVLIVIDQHVGGLGWMGKTGVIIVGIGLAISAVTFGAINFYLLIQGIGYLLYGIALIRTHTAPTTSTVIVSGAFFAGPIAFLIANAGHIRTPIQYGSRNAAFALGFVVGASFMAIGLIGWARWLEHSTRQTSTNQTSPTRP